MPPPSPKPPRQPFTATRADGIFAIACFVLGLLFIRWAMPWQGWGVAAFTVLYGGGVLLYARAKGVRPPLQSWWWLAVMLGCAAAFALWPAGLPQASQSLLLLGAAAYWCACLFGMLMAGKTGNLLGLDAINLLYIVPFRNYDAPVRGLAAFRRPAGQKKGGRFWRRMAPVALGLALAAILLAIVLPMLASADAIYFGTLINLVTDFIFNIDLIEWLGEEVFTLFVQFMLGVPVAWYLYGLISGGAHKRYAKNIGVVQAKKTLDAAHIAPQSTILIVMVLVSAVYVVFIACQQHYFFAAFRGIKPSEFNVYSEYAREGFFELCRIAAINLTLLALANSLCKKPTAQNRPLRVANLLLCLLTLLVIATAFSKMSLYITMQGFTQKRIMTCVFMAFLALVCVAAAVRQFVAFSVVRLAAVVGSAMLCLMCLVGLDGFVVRQNAQRYTAGTLPTFDELIVSRSGPAGVPHALRVYKALDDEADHEQKLRLAYALNEAYQRALEVKGTPRDNVASMRARALDIPQIASGSEAEYRAFIKQHFPEDYKAWYGGDEPDGA